MQLDCCIERLAYSLRWPALRNLRWYSNDLNHFQRSPSPARPDRRCINGGFIARVPDRKRSAIVDEPD